MGEEVEDPSWQGEGAPDAQSSPVRWATRRAGVNLPDRLVPTMGGVRPGEPTFGSSAPLADSDSFGESSHSERGLCPQSRGGGGAEIEGARDGPRGGETRGAARRTSGPRRPGEECALARVRARERE